MLSQWRQSEAVTGKAESVDKLDTPATVSEGSLKENESGQVVVTEDTYKTSEARRTIGLTSAIFLYALLPPP